MTKQLVNKRRLAMVHMGYNCNISYMFHTNRQGIGKMVAPDKLVNEV